MTVAAAVRSPSRCAMSNRESASSPIGRRPARTSASIPSANTSPGSSDAKSRASVKLIDSDYRPGAALCQVSGVPAEDERGDVEVGDLAVRIAEDCQDLALVLAAYAPPAVRR